MKKGLERVDLLSLPASERLKVYKEIHAALAKRVEEAKLVVDDDTLVMDKSILDDSPLDLGIKENHTPANSAQKASAMNSLLKRIW